jgi:hypothetical protein
MPTVVDFLRADQAGANPEALPGAWPIQSKEVPDNAAASFSPNNRANDADFRAYLATHQAAYNAWLAAKIAAAPVSTGDKITRESRHGSAALDFGSILGGTSIDLTMSVPGAKLGDCVMLGIPNQAIAGGANTTNVIFMAWVSAADVVTIRCSNNTDPIPAADPVSGTFNVICITVGA